MLSQSLNNPEHEPTLEKTMVIKQTVDCGLQAEQFPVAISQETKKARKRVKRKQYRKRKKQKQLEYINEIRLEIAHIIQEIYDQEISFQDVQDHLIDIIDSISDFDFKTFLDRGIKQQIFKIHLEFDDFIQQMIETEPFDQDRFRTHFYIVVLEKIEHIYERIVKASYEIQQIINLHLNRPLDRDQTHKQSLVFQNLAKNTFQYLLDTGDPFKKYLYACKKIIPLAARQYGKIYDLLAAIEYPHNISKDSDSEAEYSTTFSQQDSEDFYFEDHKGRRRSKRSKLSQSEDIIYLRVQESLMNINPNRQQQCNVTPEWLKKISKKYLR